MKNRVKEFVENNLGKSAFFVGNYNGICAGMIVGYDGAQVLLSMTNNNGWQIREDDTDVILVHSPLNVSYWYSIPEFLFGIDNQIKVCEDGFTWAILDKETACNIHQAYDNIEIYKLYDDDSEGLIECLDDIYEHGGQFGIELNSR